MSFIENSMSEFNFYDFIPVFERILYYVCPNTLHHLIRINRFVYENYQNRLLNDWAYNDRLLQKMNATLITDFKLIDVVCCRRLGVEFQIGLTKENLLCVQGMSFQGSGRLLFKFNDTIKFNPNNFTRSLAPIPYLWTKRKKTAVLLDLELSKNQCVQLLFYSIDEPLIFVSTKGEIHPELTDDYKNGTTNLYYIEPHRFVKFVERELHYWSVSKHKVITVKPNGERIESKFQSTAYSLPTVGGLWYIVDNTNGLDFYKISKPKGRLWFTLKLNKSFQDVVIFKDFAIVILKDTNMLVNIIKRVTVNIPGCFKHSHVDSRGKFLLTFDATNNKINKYTLNFFQSLFITQ